MNVTLNPVVVLLVNEEVSRCNSLPKSKLNPHRPPATADDVVNEILWLALRDRYVKLCKYRDY
jgi:hypothetical protein